MAIDSAAKRASALGIGLVFTLLVIPDSTIAQPDRQTIAHSYSGILATAPVIDTQDCFLSIISTISDEPLSIVSTIGDGLSVGSAVNDDILSITSTIKDNLSVVSSINDDDLSITSAIKDSLSITSVICNC